MAMPVLRKRVYISVEGKNISLDDLRGSSYPGIEVVSVETIDYTLYNSKIVLKVDPSVVGENNGPHAGIGEVLRSCLYDRIDIRDIVPIDLQIPVMSLQLALEFLNSHGFDFTEDDLEIVNWVIQTKPTSLGYIGDLAGNGTVGGNYLRKENMDYLLLENGSKILL